MNTHPLLLAIAAGGAVLLGACNRDAPEPDPEWRHYGERLGDPIDGLDAETLASFERGREMMVRNFTPETGLGPTFNAESCDSCHGVPIPGGGAPRYRDFFLVRTERWDGTPVDHGSNGSSPVRNLYVYDGAHVSTPLETDDPIVFARRNAPPMFGVGLFEFVSDAHILTREDPDDADGDGISGRANYEQGRVGRFGVKSQASNLESFNRGAMFNQMGLTSNPLFFVPPDEPVASVWPDLDDVGRSGADLFGTRSAWAQVSAPGEPTLDDDGVPDPEMTDQDQLDLLTFSIYVAPPRPAERTKETRRGARHFDDVGCTSCHVPELESRVGPLPAYTDLLVHDLGEANSDGLKVALAAPSEFRTAPLWGVALTAPYLHDGSADTLQDAIAAHGGEAAASRDAFAALDADEQAELIGFLESLSPYVDERPGMLGDEAALPESDIQPDADDVGVPGGPLTALDGADRELWLEGRELFDRNLFTDEGLGTVFNADSCRACHQDPVLGGAGGADTNVIRIAEDTGTPHGIALDRPFQFRVVTPGALPQRYADVPLIVETRQPPTLLGVGMLESISEEAILAHEDPTDLDGDGISGRARTVGSTIGRFGWKAQIPTVRDFAADALFVELGATLPQDVSIFTGTDDDAVADPELPASDNEALTFYMANLAPHARKPAEDAAQADRGEAVFDELGCSSCHVPELDGVPAYTDLLLHDVADPFAPLVDQEGESVLPTEFRTPPLWGISDTGPYLHDGSAFTLDAAILGHHGEALDSRDRWEALPEADRVALRVFLQTL